ncbi:MAG: prephenate dehydrogenase [Cyclobacteriaceae bacterium]
MKRNDLHVLGVDTDPDHAITAKSLGLIDEVTTFEEGIVQSDLVVLATPVSTMEQQISSVLDILPDNSTLIDLGSTKARLVNAARRHPKRKRYVATHPIAGTENSGPTAAFATLMRNKMMILCNKEESDQDAVDLVEQVFRDLEMRINYMDATEHDRHIAYVSHLSHISSFALGATVLDKEKDEQSIFVMAGSGFSSTVRLAKSSANMWAPIFSQNKENVLDALDAYIGKLQYFREIIANNDEVKSRKLMNDTNEIRRVLLGIDKRE